ncbi:PE-PPE domain-containing protein [Streptomyces natalensis]|uniref:PE-PPE domain-containing protein n=1 Tax=Streptomyces natalensis ATCC 27448 TaxID=1240678 RepID=A0A0D7CHF3_9ACTN|nr:PE-PPE domain-containing protein [Streptomyces natalensis]KIZ15280.1 PE-PPE domain-containing protein [Streptomyces natalensis ATCC 27448]
MTQARRWKKAIGAAGATAAMVALSTAAPAVAHADQVHHYYLEVGGTGSAAPAPDCTGTYGFANKHLNGGIPVPVCYPASAGPWLNGHNAPDVTAPSFDASVREGYRNLLAAAEDTYHRDPGARFTIVGYSQGAQVADQVLATISEGGTDIPRSQVNGMLYSDPMQPDTGIWSRVPKGWSALGFTSTGAGRTTFDGVPVQRFCIRTDLACDATSLQSIPGFLNQHPKYWQDGNVMTQTIGHDGGDGVVWYEPDGRVRTS